MSWFIQTCQSSLGKKYIMALTGFMLGGFLLVHTIGNSTIFWGREAFNSYAHHLHSMGIFVPLFELCLLTIFLIHVFTGILLWFQNRAARGTQRYSVNKNPGGRTWGSQTMIYTGATMLVFVLIHLFNFHFVVKTDTYTISDVVTKVLNNPGFTLLYIIGLGALALHISHGFWSILQTLGISHPRWNYPLRVVAWALTVIMTFVFILVTLWLLVDKSQLLG